MLGKISKIDNYMLVITKHIVTFTQYYALIVLWCFLFHCLILNNGLDPLKKCAFDGCGYMWPSPMYDSFMRGNKKISQSK